jgi:hypothetical protein
MDFNNESIKNILFPEYIMSVSSVIKTDNDDYFSLLRLFVCNRTYYNSEFVDISISFSDE